MRHPAAAMVAAGALLLGLSSAALAGDFLTLSQPRPLAKGLTAMPRIAAPQTPAVARINAAMQRLDADAVKSAAECRADAKSSPTTEEGDYQRSTEVTMRGPGFFSLTVTDSYFCGGAHPDDSSLALVYDLDSGRPVNWLSYLPAAMKATASLQGEGATRAGVISSQVLQDLYIKALRAKPDGPEWSECGEVLTEPHTLLVWPDAKGDGLAVQPSDLVHVVSACGDAATVPTATLRRLGVSARLLDAIDQAHAATKAP